MEVRYSLGTRPAYLRRTGMTEENPQKGSRSTMWMMMREGDFHDAEKMAETGVGERHDLDVHEGGGSSVKRCRYPCDIRPLGRNMRDRPRQDSLLAQCRGIDPYTGFS